MKEYAKKFLEVAFEYDALQLGQFELKSGRISPYFFNVGMLRSGDALRRMGDCYAQVLCAEEFFTEEDAPILFGPTYKGLLIAVATAISLTEYSENASISSLRKEKKEHGEGGLCIGQPIDNRHVVVLEDVVSGGETIRNVLQYIRSLSGFPVGAVIGFDRQERDMVGGQPVIQVLRRELEVRIESIATLSDMCEFVRNHRKYRLFFEPLNAYREEFCVS
ncbi:MAG: orotate phosphoribosyltransferase [Candidatus Moraniibacteriota bacterium]